MSTGFATRFKDEELLADFKTFVIEKYTTTYGNLTKELSKAMKEHLATENYKDYPTKVNMLDRLGDTRIGVSQTHKKFKPSQITLIRRFEQQFISHNRISDIDLRNFIKDTLNVYDVRSINSKIDFLVLNDYIKNEYNHWVNLTDPYYVNDEIFPEG